MFEHESEKGDELLVNESKGAVSIKVLVKANNVIFMPRIQEKTK